MMKKKKILVILLSLVIIAAGSTAAIFAYNSFFKPGADIAAVTYPDPQIIGMYLSNQDSEFDPATDSDLDGITDIDEITLGTDPYNPDTDSDGIPDYDEVNETNTDPLVYDTDEDGLSDGVELMAGLDPLSTQTNDGVSDKTFPVTYNIEYDENCTFIISGNANVYNTYFSEAQLTGIRTTPGVVSSAYEFYCADEYKSAHISISYDESLIENRDIDPDSLAIYSFNEDGSFTKVNSSQVDTDRCAVTASIKYSGKFMIGYDEAIGESNLTSQVMLLIDNSGSMFPVELCETSEENDVDFKRIDMAQTLIDMCDESVSFGVAKFTKTYTQLADIGTDEDEIYDLLDDIRTDPEEFNGTYIANSIKSALENFDAADDEHRNFIVILTDGATTEGTLFDMSFYDENDAIQDAIEKNVTVITIGLGNELDVEYLQKIADQTSGRFVFANNADALDEVYDAIIGALNYDITDEGILVADTGFKPASNGFSFVNYGIETDNMNNFGGQCYGIASFVQLHYSGKLPLSMDAASYTSSSLNKYTLSSEGYDITSIDFFNPSGDLEFADANKSLYNYTNSALTAMQQLKDIPVEERYDWQEDKSLTFSEAAREIIDNCPFIIIKDLESSTELDWDGEKTYKKYEWAYFSTKGMDTTALSEEELECYNFFASVERLFVNQISDECTENSETFPTIELLPADSQVEQFEEFIQTLKSGVPIILSANGKLGGASHAVNATRLYRDFDNPNEYILVVYDSNYPGVEHHLKIVKNDSHWYDFNMTHYRNKYNFTVYDLDGTFPDTTPDSSISLEIFHY